VGSPRALRGCRKLRELDLKNNLLMPTDENKAHFEKQTCGRFTI